MNLSHYRYKSNSLLIRGTYTGLHSVKVIRRRFSTTTAYTLRYFPPLQITELFSLESVSFPNPIIH